jgi:nicotinamidase-related amidase
MPADVLEQTVRNVAVLIETARRMWLPIVVSQQYPRGLGATVPAIEDALRDAPTLHRFDKMQFSAADTPDFSALAPKLGRDQWIVTGMEAHVCVYQTARDLVDHGFAVHVAADGVVSRRDDHREIGLELCREAGAVISCSETVVFDWLVRAGGETFKRVSALVR